MNRIIIKFDTKLKPTKHIVVNHNFTLASLNQFGCSILPKPDPRPDYEDVLFRDFREGSNTSRCVMPSLKDENLKRMYLVYKTPTSANGPELDGMQLLWEAHRAFETFKGLIVGLLFSSKDREWSRDLFLTRTPAKAFRLIECELNFMYEYLHTKVVVVHCLFGYVLRFISFTLIIGAILAFFSIENQHEFHKFDFFVIILLMSCLLGH